MQITSTLAAVALAATAVAGGVAGAAVHAVATANVQVACPASPSTPVNDDDLHRFMKRPAPPITGNPRY